VKRRTVSTRTAQLDERLKVTASAVLVSARKKKKGKGKTLVVEITRMSIAWTNNIATIPAPEGCECKVKLEDRALLAQAGLAATIGEAIEGNRYTRRLQL